MTCKICGRPSPAGAKLCADCRAARKRAYDATITQPLFALAGAGTVSRTLSRLRRSDASPEAKARRAARKAKAATEAVAPAAPPATAQGSARSRLLLWALLSVGVVLAAVAGWHLPSRAPVTGDGVEASSATPAAPSQGASGSGIQPASVKPAEPASAAATLPPLPTIVERELVPSSPAPVKPTTSKRAIAAPKAPPPVEAAAEVEIARVPAPAPAPAPKPAPGLDPWQQMAEAIGRCPDGFLGRVVCEQRLRLQFCDGHWGQVPQCPGGPNVDHN